MSFYTYILASKRNGTLYVGSTDDLAYRVWQHREKHRRGFTSRYDVTRLVWYEVHANAESAITRERQLKKWRRAWKVQLLSEANPDWTDLAPQILAEWGGGSVAGGGTVEQDGTAKEDGFPRTRE